VKGSIHHAVASGQQNLGAEATPDPQEATDATDADVEVS